MNCVISLWGLRCCERPTQGAMTMVRYRRSAIPGSTLFFTANLRNRRSDLFARHIGALRQAVADVQQVQPFIINAWVVLPEHMHCIWTLPPDDHDFSQRWRALKRNFTQALRMRDIWQPRFWEHTLRDERDYRRHVDYCYFNPVKHGWVASVREWPYSSFHRDGRRGLYPADWGGDVGEMDAGERR